MGGYYYLRGMEEFFSNIYYNQELGIIVQGMRIDSSKDMILVVYDKQGNYQSITHVIMEEEG